MFTSAVSPPSQPRPNAFVLRELEAPLAHLLLRPLFAPNQERIILLAFDEDDRLLRFQEVAGSTIGKCEIPHHIWHDLLGPDVVGVVMAHNHPSGTAWPSEADRQITIRIASMLEVLGIALLDHLIFVDDGHFNFRKAGLL